MAHHSDRGSQCLSIRYTERLHSAIGYIPPPEAELRHLDPPKTIGMVA